MNPVRSKKSKIPADSFPANRTSNGMKECVIILDNIRSVENVGSIFRTAEGLGVLKIILVGITPAPLDRFRRERKDFIKVSLGAEKLIEWKYEKNIKSAIVGLKSQGFKVVALEQHPKANKLSSYNTKKLHSFALIVGNEVEGVSKEALKLADDIIEISMMGLKESLNVSVAVGVALFALLK